VLPPNEEELVKRRNGTAKWLNDLLFQTTNLVKAGWMTKDGTGTWTITDKGALRICAGSSGFDGGE